MDMNISDHALTLPALQVSDIHCIAYEIEAEYAVKISATPNNSIFIFI